MRLFLDVNVVLDVLARREPWFADAARVLAAIERGEASGHIAAHTVTTLHYLLCRHLGPQETAAKLLDLTALLTVEPVDRNTLQQALALGWPDFEDAVQAVVATQCRADRLLTRNPKDFRLSPVPVVSPAEWLAHN